MVTIVGNQTRATARFSSAAKSGATYQAYQTLHVAFVLAPLLAGIDKFFDLLTNWEMYLAPAAVTMLGEHAHQFMMLVGVIEIIAAIGVALKPRYFAWVVAIWLVAIIINLLMCGTFFDIALRDFGLFLGAIALGRLATLFDSP